MRIALDAMGGDHAPAAMAEGALLYARETGEPVTLVGDERRVKSEIARLGAGSDARLRVIHADEVIEMAESPGQAIRKKRRSSIRVCFDLLKAGEADAMVSAGNSGAVMAGAIFVLGRLDGVERPAIGTLLPTLDAHALLIDAGANIDCKPLHLVQFAAMGEVYARRVMGFDKPRVGLLSNGEEESKGTQLTREALAALKKSDIRFLGYCEGRHVFTGEVEVVVTDGFTGNVLLKTAEGAASAIGGLIRREVNKGLFTRLGAWLMKPAFAGVKKQVDYSEYGGAPLLGVDGVTMVAHGRSTAVTMKNALKAARHMARADLETGGTGHPLRAEFAAAAQRAERWLAAAEQEPAAGQSGVGG